MLNPITLHHIVSSIEIKTHNKTCEVWTVDDPLIAAGVLRPTTVYSIDTTAIRHETNNQQLSC